MNSNFQIISNYFDLTSPKGRTLVSLLPQISELLDGNFIFSGQLMTNHGRQEYLSLIDNFLDDQNSIKINKLSASEDNVCATSEFVVNAPDGCKVKRNLAEIFKVHSSKLVSHENYNDPRAYARAFGMSKEQ